MHRINNSQYNFPKLPKLSSPFHLYFFDTSFIIADHFVM